MSDRVPCVSADPALLIERLAAGLREEEGARARRQAALAAQAHALRELREAGVSSSRIAHRVARALGLALSLDARRRLAAALRKRCQRARHLVTSCPGNPVASASARPIADLGSRRATEPRKDDPMSKLIRKTVTVEEYLDEEALGAADEVEDEEVEEDDAEAEGDADEDPAPKKRTARQDR